MTISGVQGINIGAPHISRDLQIGTTPSKARSAELDDQQVRR